MKTETADVLVMMPHPDDAEFGCAGTVARWAKEGRRVVYIVCTDGDKGTSDRSLTPERLAVIRRAEQQAARVRNLKLDARVEERFRIDTQHWLDLQGESPEALSVEQLRRWGITADGLGTAACP